MIVFKSRNGFTLVETLFAVTIVALSIMPLFRLQTRVLLSSSSYALHMQRIFLMKNYRYEIRQVLQKTFQSQQTVEQLTRKKTVTDPQTSITYTFEPLAKSSSLYGTTGVYRERVTAEWVEHGVQQKDELVAFVFKAPIPKQEKERS